MAAAYCLDAPTEFQIGLDVGVGIKPEDTERLAREVAARRGEGLTETIHHALSEELRRLALGAPKTDRIDEDLAALYALLDAGGPGNGRTLTGIEADMYGEVGQPI